jgi:hypothetical protein
MGGHKDVWAVAVGVVCALGLLGVLGGVVGCGQDGSSSTTASVGVSAEGGSEAEGVFADLAQALAPMPVYGLDELPSGVIMAPEWWPVVEIEVPSEYDGPAIANPRVSGEGEIDQEVQIVFSDGDGWVVVLENFRGDVGDVDGESAGTVAGNVATLYEVNGGVLVQWSDDGRWYGVFGRGVSEADVVEMAVSMRLIDGSNAE